MKSDKQLNKQFNNEVNKFIDKLQKKYIGMEFRTSNSYGDKYTTEVESIINSGGADIELFKDEFDLYFLDPIRGSGNNVSWVVESKSISKRDSKNEI